MLLQTLSRGALLIAAASLLTSSGCGTDVGLGKRADAGTKADGTVVADGSPIVSDSRTLPDASAPADLLIVRDMSTPADGCIGAPPCNWCGGTPFTDSKGCIVGYSCLNGQDACKTQPCGTGGSLVPSGCGNDETCIDKLCWKKQGSTFPCGNNQCAAQQQYCHEDRTNGAPTQQKCAPIPRAVAMPSALV